MKRIRSWACGGSNVKSSNWVILLLVDGVLDLVGQRQHDRHACRAANGFWRHWCNGPSTFAHSPTENSDI
jgi:hypothetical protein